MGRSNFFLLLLFSAITTGGSEASDSCFNSCIKLLRETSKTSDDMLCSKTTDTSYQAEQSCRLNCKNVLSTFGNDTGFSEADHEFISATSSPSLYISGYNFMTIKWNTSEKMSKNVAFYILQMQPNTQLLQSPLEIPPSIPRYIIVQGKDPTSTQTYTVDNLVNGFEYKFRVGAVGFNKTSSQFSHWSSWYATSGSCNRTTGLIVTGFPFQKKQQVMFPCSVSRVTLRVSIKAVNKKPVVLDGNLTWQNPPSIDLPTKQLVQVTVKLLKDEDESIDAKCAHYHDTDFTTAFFTDENVTSWHLPATDSDSPPKKSIHFGCSYTVKFEIKGAQGSNSFESTTMFKIPECLQNITSCPVPDPRSDKTSSFITEKILFDGNGNSSYAANISWNAERWMKSHKIEFFNVEIEEWPFKQSGGFFYTKDVPAKDGVVLYHAVASDMSEGKGYQVVIRAYHGLNCVHDILERKEFQIQKPCADGCTKNATCWPPDTFDGTAKCKCKIGFSGNGTLCRETEAQKPCNNACSENATCSLVDGIPKCKCNVGFSGNGKSCTETEAQKPCNNACSENATCSLVDGIPKCKCNVGFSGNGKSCTAIEPKQIQGDEGNKTNVLAIVLPLAFVMAFVALVFAFITWRIKKKKELVLSTIEAHESTISPSSSNTNLYQHYPPRYNEKGKVSTKENEVVELDEKEVNVIYVPQEIQDAISHGLTDGYEFNAEQIKFEECLGRGAFGYVHRARALGITAEPEWTLVAVKTLNEPVTDKSVEDFIAEIELMKKLEVHEDIIEMLGCCTLTLPICLIMEYAPYGNLLAYLRAIKTKLAENDSTKKSSTLEKLELKESSAFDKENLALDHGSVNKTQESNLSGIEAASKSQMESLIETNAHLESFALQIARGMAYVAGRGIVHRDLAARNILIGKDYKLKISDFGLSKEGVYVKSTSGKIPLRWLSIEAIRERIYSSASDVWSYGIVLWEICTLGDFPYPTLSDRQLLKYLLTGERLEKPINCTDKMYNMMLECWQALPEDRPTFAHLRDVLWKMNTGENPYINIEPMPDDFQMTTEPESHTDVNSVEV